MRASASNQIAALLMTPMETLEEQESLLSYTIPVQWWPSQRHLRREAILHSSSLDIGVKISIGFDGIHFFMHFCSVFLNTKIPTKTDTCERALTLFKNLLS